MKFLKFFLILILFPLPSYGWELITGTPRTNREIIDNICKQTLNPVLVLQFGKTEQTIIVSIDENKYKLTTVDSESGRTATEILEFKPEILDWAFDNLKNFLTNNEYVLLVDPTFISYSYIFLFRDTSVPPEQIPYSDEAQINERLYYLNNYLINCWLLTGIALPDNELRTSLNKNFNKNLRKMDKNQKKEWSKYKKRMKKLGIF